jgi:hypothetical protein
LTKIKQEIFFGITRGRRLIRIKAFVASLPIILVPDFCGAQSRVVDQTYVGRGAPLLVRSLPSTG